MSESGENLSNEMSDQKIEPGPPPAIERPPEIPVAPNSSRAIEAD